MIQAYIYNHKIFMLESALKEFEKGLQLIHLNYINELNHLPASFKDVTDKVESIEGGF